MNEIEIHAVKRAFSRGTIYWHFDHFEPLVRVVKIGTAPAPDPGDVPELSEVAYLENGQHVALYNADLTQFVKKTPISVDV